MNKITKYGPMLIMMLLLASTVILLKGCGGNQDAAELIGCPKGSLLANTGDKFLVVPDDDASASAIVYSGSIETTLGAQVVPLVYQVTDKNDEPRNKICVKFYTNGSFWAQDTWYGTLLPNPLTVETDMSGMATLYWSTAPLLVSNPATTAPEAGANHGPYTSFVNAYSGPVLDLFTYDVTISGCPKGTIGSCP
jgi:hypothetical protein